MVKFFRLHSQQIENCGYSGKELYGLPFLEDSECGEFSRIYFWGMINLCSIPVMILDCNVLGL